MKNPIRVFTSCPMCHRDHVAIVENDDYELYCSGEPVSKCFPYIPAAERERFITGICPDCWDRMFPPEEDDDEDEYFEDEVDETGFNPYMGCYDYDC